MLLRNSPRALSVACRPRHCWAANAAAARSIVTASVVMLRSIRRRKKRTDGREAGNIIAVFAGTLENEAGCGLRLNAWRKRAAQPELPGHDAIAHHTDPKIDA